MTTIGKDICLTDNGFEILEDFQMYHNHVERAIFNEYSGLLGHPDEGSLVPQMMWDIADEQTAFDMMNEIEELVNDDVPQLTMASLSVEVIPVQGSSADLFAIKMDAEHEINDKPVELEFFKIRTIGA